MTKLTLREKFTFNILRKVKGEKICLFEFSVPFFKRWSLFGCIHFQFVIFDKDVELGYENDGCLQYFGIGHIARCTW